jgi:hypothetical protein
MDAYQSTMKRRLAMLDPANISVRETLRSGQQVEIRSQRPPDRKDLEAALARALQRSSALAVALCTPV